MDLSCIKCFICGKNKRIMIEDIFVKNIFLCYDCQQKIRNQWKDGWLKKIKKESSMGAIK